MAKTAIGVGLLAAVLTALTVLRYFSAGQKPGFTLPGVFITEFNLALQIVLVLGLTFGAFLARRGSIRAHRINQTTWVLVNAALVLFMMGPAMAEVMPTSVADFKHAHTAVAWVHAIIGTLTVTAGLWLVLQMNDIIPVRFHVLWWKKLMRLTLAGYWTVLLFGLATYYFAYY